MSSEEAQQVRDEKVASAEEYGTWSEAFELGKRATPSAQPEAVVPEVLEKCARLLGGRYYVHQWAGYSARIALRGIPIIGDSDSIHPTHVSDGDLLLAILNKAADSQGGAGWVLSALAIAYDRKSSPIVAAINAFAYLERP